MSRKNSRFTTDIGGYFGLDLPDYGDPFPDAIKFQSGRAALRALIESADIRRVILPDYICDSVIQAVVDSGAAVETYLLDESLYPKNLPSSLEDKCLFLYVNYFGLCQNNVYRILENFPSGQLIVDNSQALFASNNISLATIYSPRKFVGVPDGGLLVTSKVKIITPENDDTGSFGRMKHLLLRMAYSAQDGYLNYLDSESSLNCTKPLRMSQLSKRLLASVDMTSVARIRRNNFLLLSERLGQYNIFKWELEIDVVPLCYPLLLSINVESLKKTLVEKGIYIPTYWPDVSPRVSPNSIEYQLTNCCLAIPCDQRYSSNQMYYLADEIISGLNNR